MDINNLLRIAVMKGASDLHLKVGTKPIVRVNGELVSIDNAPLITHDELVTAVFKILSTEQKDHLKKKFEIDMAYGVKGLGRFRLNIYQQRGTLSMVFRTIPAAISSIRDLGLPNVVEKLSNEHRGLILVTGTTGSGKTTTLAAMLHYINETRRCNIISIEDPIEYLHSDNRSIISQREIGADTESFSVALRSALRQDPDVIMVGEMRDFETISTAISAAETGHLVMSTLHTTNAQETIHRIISVFPPYQQKQVRIQLASVIRGIVSMRLVPRKDGKGRVPAVEAMVSTQTIKEAIIDPDKTRGIYDIIANGRSQYGMQTFDQALLELVRDDVIEYQEALKWCTNVEDFILKMQGIDSTNDISWEIGASPAKKDEKQQKEEPKFKIERFGKDK